MKQEKLSAAQIRAACAMLDWDGNMLAAQTGLSEVGARRILRGASAPQKGTAEKIRTVLERQGLKFTDAGGVEPDYGFVRVLQGADIYPELLDEITATLRGTPELAAAVKKSLEIRGDKATGWATAWRMTPLTRSWAPAPLAGYPPAATRGC